MKASGVAWFTLALVCPSAASAAVVFSSTGAASYSYSASGNGSLPSVSHATWSNITVARYTQFAAPTTVTGLTNIGGTTGTITFHFQTAPGLWFSDDVNMTIVSGRQSSGTVTASYSNDNSTWIQWGLNNSSLDMRFNATNVAEGETDLYVRFVMNGNATGNTVLTWGGTPGERSFVLSGTVIPESSSLSLLGLGGLTLLRRRR